MINRLIPVSWNTLVRRLHALGFDGPYHGGKHHFIIKGDLRLIIPNPHAADISVPLLKKILARGSISRQEWLKRNEVSGTKASRKWPQ